MSLIIHDPIQHASLFNCSHEKMCKGMSQNRHTLCGIACPAKRFILQKNFSSRPFLEVAGEVCVKVSLFTYYATTSSPCVSILFVVKYEGRVVVVAWLFAFVPESVFPLMTSTGASSKHVSR